MGIFNNLGELEREWGAFVSAPWIILPWIALAIWMWRRSIKSERENARLEMKITGLDGQISVLEQRLKLTAEKAVIANEIANHVKGEVERQFPAMEATIKAKIDAEFAKLSDANKEVSYAVQVGARIGGIASAAYQATVASQTDHRDT
jgi:hypothetical protein